MNGHNTIKQKVKIHVQPGRHQVYPYSYNSIADKSKIDEVTPICNPTSLD